MISNIVLGRDGKEPGPQKAYFDKAVYLVGKDMKDKRQTKTRLENEIAAA